MSDYKIGDDVVSIGDSSELSCMWRKDGEVVTITKIRYCPACGCQSLNVNDRPYKGYVSDIPNHLLECSCGYTSEVGNVGWGRSYLFAPLQTKSEEEDMNEAIEEALSQPAFQ